MDASKMRHRITFQRQSEEKGSLGSYEGAWENVATVWAEIRPVSGREYLSKVDTNLTTHKIFCRYRPGITTDMRIAFKGRIFRILSVINWEEKGEGLTIMCEEKA